MDGSFACPDCGCEIRLTGLSPGREVRCDWCRAVVEVPYLPRADQIKRTRRYARPRRWPAWAWVPVSVLCVAIVVAGAGRTFRSQRHTSEAEALARLVDSSRASESAGRLGEALAAIEGALTIAGRADSKPACFDDLRRNRDRLARREAQERFAEVASGGADGDPGRAVGHALTLLARTRKNEALADLEAPTLAALERLRVRWAEADSAAAAAALEAGEPGKAYELCGREARTADELPPAPRAKWLADATELARRVIARHGTVIEPVRGHFTRGSPTAYDALLNRALHDALRKNGYLPQPRPDLWDDLWASTAPYRVTTEVNERYEDTYLESANRLSGLDAVLTISRRGERLWRETPVSRTQVPVPGLPAYQASRAAVGDRRSAEFERLLYENARGVLIERLCSNLRNLPACSPSTQASAAPAGNDPVPRFEGRTP